MSPECRLVHGESCGTRGTAVWWAWPRAREGLTTPIASETSPSVDGEKTSRALRGTVRATPLDTPVPEGDVESTHIPPEAVDGNTHGAAESAARGKGAGRARVGERLAPGLPRRVQPARLAVACSQWPRGLGRRRQGRSPFSPAPGRALARPCIRGLCVTRP